MAKAVPFIKAFADISLDDLALVGGKNASLGELTQSLNDSSIEVPEGFAVTTAAFQFFLEQDGLKQTITDQLQGLDKSDLSNFKAIGKAIRSAVLSHSFPDEITDAIQTAYRELSKDDKVDISVAVRSSATAEDLPGLSFAGQHDSFLFINSSTDLMEACKRCYASLYNDRALSYRIDQGVDHLSASISVGIQKMVKSSDASSGVIFTIDPETGNRQTILISSVYGTGEAIVQGLVEPDEYYIHKQTFNDGFRCVYRHKIGKKHMRLVSDSSNNSGKLKKQNILPHIQHTFCLTDTEIVTLADAALAIEKHYSDRYGQTLPTDFF